MTVPLDAFQARAMDVLVLDVTRKLPGTPGVPGPVPPPHDVPLMVQLTGSPVPAVGEQW